MKTWILIFILAIFAGGALAWWQFGSEIPTRISTIEPQTLPETQSPIVGNDRDAHGCIGSAGYSWCEAKQKCLRIWEEKCETVSQNQDQTFGANNNPTTTVSPAPVKPDVIPAPAKTPEPVKVPAPAKIPEPAKVNITTAPTQYPGCFQMDASRNNLSEQRVNIVFVGVNYPSVNDFTEAVKLAADVGAEKDGFFSVEPFRSNRNKFNIFYVTNIMSIPEESATVPISSETDATLGRSIATCNFSNRFGFILVNTSKNLNFPNISGLSGSSNMALPEHGSISIFKYPPQDNNAILRAQRLLVHEGGGHNIGSLFDEYVIATWLPDPTERNETYPTFKNQCYVVNPSAISCQLNSGYYSCNLGTNPAAESDCLLNASWRDLIGNGCGQDGVVDCTGSDANYRKEVRCWTNKCSVNSFGSVSNDSIMSAQNSFVMADEFTREPFFGAQDERLICRRIKDLAGSAGGICNSLCLSGCPNGQYCGAGTCRSR